MTADRDLTGFGAPPPAPRDADSPSTGPESSPSRPRRAKRQREGEAAHAPATPARSTTATKARATAPKPPKRRSARTEAEPGPVLDLTAPSDTSTAPSSAAATDRRSPTAKRAAPEESSPPVESAKHDDPISTDERPPATPVRPGKRQRRKRINLSLPIPLATALRTYTEDHNTFYLDVIVRAHALHRPIVMEGLRIEDGALPALRRRQPSGRLQVALGVPPDFLAQLDREAAELDIDRSSYVTALLQQHLRQPRKN